ncbi:MAG TPA: DMT family transporter [Gaiellaceae bacterium]|nr:DMT family transporter [Gaiellaceae bacterium]
MDELAALLAILAAIFFALAATLWQRASLALGVEAGGPQALLRLLGSGVWLLGLVAQGAGVVLQAAALDRGRVAIIQPLLVTTIIWALPLGYFLTNQVIAIRHIVGAAVVVAGLAMFASFGDPAAGIDDAATSTWVSAFLVLGAVCAGLLLFARRGGLGVKAAVLGATAGVLYGVSATLMKPVVESLHDVGVGGVLESWEFWVMAGAGLIGFYIQQLSLATGRLVASVATVSAVNPVVSVLLGALVLQERLDKTPEWHAVVAVGALSAALFGAILIASATEKDAEVATAPAPVPA